MKDDNNGRTGESSTSLRNTSALLSGSDALTVPDPPVEAHEWPRSRETDPPQQPERQIGGEEKYEARRAASTPNASIPLPSQPSKVYGFASE